jgi:hypothetical protein
MSFGSGQDFITDRVTSAIILPDGSNFHCCIKAATEQKADKKFPEGFTCPDCRKGWKKWDNGIRVDAWHYSEWFPIIKLDDILLRNKKITIDEYQARQEAVHERLTNKTEKKEAVSKPTKKAKK